MTLYMRRHAKNKVNCLRCINLQVFSDANHRIYDFEGDNYWFNAAEIFALDRKIILVHDIWHITYLTNENTALFKSNLYN